MKRRDVDKLKNKMEGSILKFADSKEEGIKLLSRLLKNNSTLTGTKLEFKE